MAGVISRRAVTRVITAAGVFGVVVGMLVVILPAPVAVAAPGINKTINFQGKVTNTNGTNVANGSYSFTFRLYTASTGNASGACTGVCIWQEAGKSLTVTDGIFQTNLGDATALPGSVDFNTDNIYLGMTFNGDPEMAPRIQFTASPYAFNSDLLDGLDASAFAQLNPVSAQSGSLNLTGSVQAATSLQAPLVDTATAVALSIGTGTATSVTIGRTTTPFLIQGNSSSTFTATNGGNTTTVGFTTPTGTNSILFPDAGGTICTTVAATCSATYMTAGNFLSKNAADTSAAAVTAANYLYGFTNSSSAVASGVLKLDNGSNTGSGLMVIGSGNPAAGNALITANGATGFTGNIIDLQVNAASKFSVDQAGAVVTASTINGQTISAAASFTGTVTAATSLLAPLLDTASAGTLAIGTNTATAITLAQPTTVATNKTFTANGNVLIQSATDGASSFNIKTFGGGNMLTADTLNSRLGINLGGNNTPTLAGNGVEIQGALRLSGGGGAGLIDTFVTPQSSNVGTKINIPLYDPGAFGQLVAMGLPATANASSRALSLFDNRAGAHQPTLGVFAPDENNLVGFSWDGSNSVAMLKNTAAKTQIVSNGLPIAEFENFGGAAVITTGANATIQAASGNKLDITANAASTWSTLAGNLTVDSAAALEFGKTSATSISVGKTGITTTIAGTAQVGATAGTGALVNNGSTVNSVYAMANLATGGWDAGGAAATVDIYTYISANQTTAGQTLSVPAPTANTTYGRMLYLSNIGTASFTLLGTTIGAGSTATLVWANKNGGAGWTFAGADGSGILNQNSANQTGDFRISGSGQANTSFLTPLLDTPSGTTTLSIGTTNATAGISLNQSTTVSGNLTFATGSTRTVSVASPSANGAGNNFVLQAANATAGASAYSGGTLSMQGGNAAGTGNAAGGNVNVYGGTGVGTGVAGSVNLAWNGSATQGKVGVGLGTPAYQLDVAGDINTSTVFRAGGTAGASSLICTAGSVLQGQIVKGGITTAGVCKGNTIQNAYDNSGSAPVKVQEVDNSNTVSPYNTTVAATGTGNLLIAIIGVNAATSQSVSSVADNAGNTWTLAGAGYQTGANNRVEIWYAKNAVSTTAVTTTLSTGTLVSSTKILEYSNMDPSAPLDIAAAQGNASSTTAGTGTINTTNSTDLIIAAMSYASDTVTSTAPGAPWSNLVDQSPSTTKQVRSVSRLVGSTGGYSTAWTLSSALTSGAVIAAFKTTGSISSTSDLTLANAKDFNIIAADTATDPNVVINLQCVTSCGANGRFAVQNAGTDVFTVSPNGGGIAVATAANFNMSSDKTVTVTSDLAGGARSVYPVIITQANDASNNNSVGLLRVVNADTGSTAAVVSVGQVSNGTAIYVGGVTSGTILSAGNLTSGTGFNFSGATSGTAVDVGTGNALTSGVGLQFNTTSTALSSGSAVRASGSASGALSAYTGNLIDVQPTRTLTSGSINDSGRALLLSRNNTVNNAGSTYTVSGSVATLQSTCTATAGTCTDTGSILQLNQLYANASGDVMNIQGAGTGNLLKIQDTSGAPADVFVVADGGAVTASGNTTFGTAGATILKNNGATQNAVCAYTGVTGATTLNTVGKTPDVCTAFSIVTTGAASLTVPVPAAGAGSIVYITVLSSSTNAPMLLGTAVGIGSTATLVYNGSAWTYAGVGAGSGAGDLQSAYNNSTDPEIALGTAATAGISIRDNAAPISGSLLEVTDSAGTASYLTVTAAAANLGGSLTFTKEAAHTIQITDSTNAAAAGGALTVKAAAGNTSGTGGNLILAAGAGGTSGIGGAASLTGGASGGGATAGGAVTVQGGASNATAGSNGGAVSILGADGSSTGTGGTGGAITITAGSSFGTGNNTGGAVAIQGGAGSSNASSVGGAVTIQGGSAGATAGAMGGAVAITGGAGTSTGTGAAGNTVTITGGAAGGSGNNAGGATTVQGGQASGTATGGSVTIQGGAAAAVAGSTGGSVTIAGRQGSTTGTGGAGGSITLTAGAAGGSGANNGGSISLTAGAATSTGVPGVVSISTPVFTSVSETFTQTGNNQSFTSITDPALQTNLDSSGTIVMNVTGAYTGATITMPSPTNTAAGRVIYVSAASGSVAFTLAASGMSSVNMSAGNTATLVWNGTGWSGTTTASSLQQVYNNTSTSPASVITTSSTKNILFQAGVGYDNANLFQVGNSLSAQAFTVDTTNTASSTNLAQNTGIETATTGWTAYTGSITPTIAVTSTAGEYASGAGGLRVTFGSAGTGGVNNALNSAALATASTVYVVSFSMKAGTSAPTNAQMVVEYYRDGSTLDSTCATATSPALSTSQFTKFTCTFTSTGNTKQTTNFLRIRQTDSTQRIWYIDNFALIAQTAGTQNVGAVQVGGINGQALTVFTLDSFAANPFTGSSNTALLGSMYYDTTQGRIQCYESDGWGACGAAPNNSIALVPEYGNSVLNGSGTNNNGTMTANLCANVGSLAIQTSLCGSGDSYSYYKWTSTQSTAQTFDIYIKYQLPPTFRDFVDNNTIKLTSRTTNTTNGIVTLSIFKESTGTQCGSDTVINSSANTWQTTSLTGNEQSCGFVAGDFMLIKINTSAKSSDAVYASNITFTMTGK